MRFYLRLPNHLLEAAHKDLDRPHPFAFERIGFLLCEQAASPKDWGLIASTYQPVQDEHYLRSDSMGALVGDSGIRSAMQAAYRTQCSVVHVHRHDHRGRPAFSLVDTGENSKLIPTFWNVAPDVHHGAVVLSRDAARGLVWSPRDRAAHPIASIQSVGQVIKELA